MYIQSLGLLDFRNYESLEIRFSEGTNILYGDNAQGKTNILEALYMMATASSHRGVRDRDMIRFGREEAHIRTILMKNGIDYRIDMHLRSGRSKGIAINGQRLKRTAQLIGLVHIVFFSPEDLSIVKNGPAFRRRFMDQELCQLDETYLHNLTQYTKIIEQRNKLLHDIYDQPSLESTLDVWDDSLVDFGTKIIRRREQFLHNLNDIILHVHDQLSGGKEELHLIYEPNVQAEDLENEIRKSRERDKYVKSTTVGPHKDDFCFLSNDIDLRRFGSQGQQRTCALSLKLAEIELVKNLIGDSPILLLDDVLSELDSSRQNDLLGSLGGIQTIITCTGLDEFVSQRFAIDKLYRVKEGTVSEEN